MAGHSKWANIKHRKAAQDAKRGKVFTRLISELTTAARLGGSDPGDNPRLRIAMDKAGAANLPKATIERAVLRGSGELSGAGLQECIYEGYGPGGAAVLVEACTDNRNRTVAAVRHAFSSHAGNLGTDGSVAYLFNKLGQVEVLTEDEEAAMAVAEEGGAEDIEPVADGFVLNCAVEQFAALVRAADRAGLQVGDSGLVRLPSIWLDLDEDALETLEGLMDALSELDDVQEVHSNVRIPSR